MKKFAIARLIFWVLMITAFMILSPVLVHGQTPVEKPTRAEWDYPAFASAQKYELGYFAFPTTGGNCDFTATPGSSPTQTDDLGKPPTTTGVAITALLIAKPIGCYGAKLRVLDTSGLWTNWSPMSNDFFTRPPAPSVLVVR
jgi:hypothetical protein